MVRGPCIPRGPRHGEHPLVERIVQELAALPVRALARNDPVGSRSTAGLQRGGGPVSPGECSMLILTILALRPVVGLIGYHPAHATSRVFFVAGKTRNQVYVKVQNGLPGGRAFVDADVES